MHAQYDADEEVPFEAFNHVVHGALLDVGIDARLRHQRGGRALGPSPPPPHISPDSASMMRQVSEG